MTPKRDAFWPAPSKSQSAFVRGFIDDVPLHPRDDFGLGGLNPRSCAASSMTAKLATKASVAARVSIRVRARLHR